MDSEFVWGVTKVWYCAYCDARNVTTERDVFSDQCSNCTLYNELNWDETSDVSLSEARAAVGGVEEPVPQE